VAAEQRLHPPGFAPQQMRCFWCHPARLGMNRRVLMRLVGTVAVSRR
jgi:hypothetical protein